MRVEPGHQVEKYVVEKLIGEGGMASVYRVRHGQLGTRHALKVLGAVPRSIHERLKLEGQAQGHLRHPGIVAVTDLVEVHGTTALVMEYVSGPSLAQLLRRQLPNPRQLDVLGRRILSAMAFAHARGLVHRDLKPANVLVQIVGGDLVPKITDFGLAKQLFEGADAQHTRTGTAMGTPAYMAPEQIRNAKDVDERADVYSLGVLLYELASGLRPHTGDDLFELYEEVRAGRYTALDTLVPSLPPRMLHAVAAAMSGDRSARPVHAGALHDLWVGGTGEPSVPGHPEELWGELLVAARALESDLEGDAPVPDLAPGSSGTMASFSGPSGPPIAVDAPPALLEPLPPRPRRGGGMWVRAAGLVVVMMFCALAGVSFVGGALLGSEPQSSAPLGPAHIARPQDITDAQPGPPQVPSRSPSGEGTDTSARAPSPRTAAPAKPAEGNEARSASTVSATGGVRATLIDAAGARYPLAETPLPMPPGVYTVEVLFDEGSATVSLEPVTIAPGERVHIQCQTEVRRCAVER